MVPRIASLGRLIGGALRGIATESAERVERESRAGDTKNAFVEWRVFCSTRDARPCAPGIEHVDPARRPELDRRAGAPIHERSNRPLRAPRRGRAHHVEPTGSAERLDSADGRGAGARDRVGERGSRGRSDRDDRRRTRILRGRRHGGHVQVADRRRRPRCEHRRGIGRHAEGVDGSGCCAGRSRSSPP